MTTNRIKAGAGILLIFILGCLCGGLVTSVIVHKRIAALFRGGPEAVAGALEKRLSNRLGLDQAQRAQVHDILQANVQQRRQIMTPVQPDLTALNQKTFQQINAVLRPEQQEKFHQVVTTFRQQFGQGRMNEPGAPAATTNAPPAVGTP